MRLFPFLGSLVVAACVAGQPSSTTDEITDPGGKPDDPRQSEAFATGGCPSSTPPGYALLNEETTTQGKLVMGMVQSGDSQALFQRLSPATATALPETALAQLLETILEHYLNLRYGADKGKGRLGQLRRLVLGLRLGRRAP